MNWLSFIIDMLLIVVGLVLYWLEYEVNPELPEISHWWKTIRDNYFIGTGLLLFGTWEAASAQLDTPMFAWLLGDGVGTWVSVQIVAGVLLLPLVAQLLLGIIKTKVSK